MPQEIKKYPVQHPLLKKYIKFFWEVHSDYMQIRHKIIPVRNIDLKFNLSDTPHYLCLKDEEKRLEEVYFSGIRDCYSNACKKVNGKVDVMGVCFLPDGFYPFFEIPVSEFNNQLLGAGEIGFRQAASINGQLREAPDLSSRLNILEKELVMILHKNQCIPENFRKQFHLLKNDSNTIHIAEFCKRNNISIRKLERQYKKYVGVSAQTYNTLNRFQNSLNQILSDEYAKLSDIAYGNGYFDQMHFIKNFKHFAGNTPKNFILQRDTMLHIGKLTG